MCAGLSLIDGWKASQRPTLNDNIGDMLKSPSTHTHSYVHACDFKIPFTTYNALHHYICTLHPHSLHHTDHYTLCTPQNSWLWCIYSPSSIQSTETSKSRFWTTYFPHNRAVNCYFCVFYYVYYFICILFFFPLSVFVTLVTDTKFDFITNFAHVSVILLL